MSQSKPVILVVSFGTSFDASRCKTIGRIEADIAKANPGYEVRRAFTSQVIIDKLKKRDNLSIDNVEEALEKIAADGVQTLVVQPTHLMDGYEYNDVVSALGAYEGKIGRIVTGKPLLSSDEDFDAVVEALVEATAGYDDGQTAICLMGHGTGAESNAVYARLQDLFRAAGKSGYFISTVEPEPNFDEVVAAVKEAGYSKVMLRTLMVVAGDHATNDMSDLDDPDSFASKFKAAGIEPICVLEGLGQIEAVRDIYVSHVADSIAKL